MGRRSLSCLRGWWSHAGCRAGSRRQPGVQVVGDGPVRVGVESAGLTLQERPQRGLGSLGAGEAASPDGGPVVVWGGDVDGEGPRPVVSVGEQSGAVCSELAAVGVAAAAWSVDAATVGGLRASRE